MTGFTLDWNSIRPLNGGREKGFEELCAQLARAEVPVGAKFIRKGTPDAGVECYTILSDGREWAWQSKYFDSLGPSQWSQVDDSVEAALDKHPVIRPKIRPVRARCSYTQMRQRSSSGMGSRCAGPCSVRRACSVQWATVTTMHHFE